MIALHDRPLAAFGRGEAFVIAVGCLSLPNGNPAPGPKFDYKLAWFASFATYAARLIARDLPVVLAGDSNVMPTERDVSKPERWADDALFRPEVRAAFQGLVAQGWVDALRAMHPNARISTFWEYFRDAFARDAGLRIDRSPPLRRGRQKRDAMQAELPSTRVNRR